MSNRIQRVVQIFIGIIAGLFLGATLGQVLGATVGTIIDIFEFNTTHTSEIVIGGLFGLAFGAILGAGLLSLGKLLLSLSESLWYAIGICAIAGLIVGALTGVALPQMIQFFNFMIFGGSVGLWVGMSVGSFVGIWLPLRARKHEIIVTDEEKRVDMDYAQFLNKKARHK